MNTIIISRVFDDKVDSVRVRGQLKSVHWASSFPIQPTLHEEFLVFQGIWKRWKVKNKLVVALWEIETIEKATDSTLFNPFP